VCQGLVHLEAHHQTAPLGCRDAQLGCLPWGQQIPHGSTPQPRRWAHLTQRHQSYHTQHQRAPRAAPCPQAGRGGSTLVALPARELRGSARQRVEMMNFA
jgi:hypothetical protein